MRLFWCPKTRAARAVWMLEELGRPYERVLVDIRDDSQQQDPGFIAASPMGKVPALEDGEVRLAESAAICLYVADRYSAGNLAPTIDDKARGRYLYWMLYTPAVIEPAIGEKFSAADPNRFQNGWGDYEAMIDTLEKGLGDNPWILGENFCAADVLLGSSVVFMRQFGLLPDSAVLNGYADRCLERPGHQTAIALDE